MRHPIYTDLNGTVHYSEYTSEPKRRNSSARRFCECCGKLRKCYFWQGVVRCEDCSRLHNAPMLRDAWLSATTRDEDHRRIQSHTRKVNARYRDSYRAAGILSPRRYAL